MKNMFLMALTADNRDIEAKSIVTTEVPEENMDFSFELSGIRFIWYQVHSVKFIKEGVYLFDYAGSTWIFIYDLEVV